MPVITIWNAPQKDKARLKSAQNYIKEKVFVLGNLRLTSEDEITVLFPQNILTTDEGRDIIVCVSGLFYKPERSKPVLDALAQLITIAVSNNFRGARVECFVEVFDQHRSGFHCEDLRKKD